MVVGHPVPGQEVRLVGQGHGRGAEELVEDSDRLGRGGGRQPRPEGRCGLVGPVEHVVGRLLGRGGERPSHPQDAIERHGRDQHRDDNRGDEDDRSHPGQ